MNFFSPAILQNSQDNSEIFVNLMKKNPCLAMAGVFKDDPQFEQMLEAIENYRRELDKFTEDTFGQE